MPKVRVSGAWKNPKSVFVKVTTGGSTSWRTVNEGWVKVSGTWRKAYGLPPSAPTITGVTLANGQAYASTATVSVAFTAGSAGGSAITGYTVTSSSGNTNTGVSSPITIADNIGVSRTYTVSASNIYGTSESSTASSAITPSTIPQVPTIGTPSITNTTTVSLPFTGSNGGSTLTSLTITSSPSVTLSYTGANSPISVTGTFATNQSYTFIMSATNARGTSTSSSSSSSIIPNPYVEPPPPPPDPCVSNAGSSCGYYSDGTISCYGTCVGATAAPPPPASDCIDEDAGFCSGCAFYQYQSSPSGNFTCPPRLLCANGCWYNCGTSYSGC
jgi:hypothetical protein